MQKFNELYKKILNECIVETIPIEIKTFVKKRFRKHAYKTDTPGTVMTREGEVSYDAGDYIAFDNVGGQYPIKADEFNNLYEPTDNPEYWLSKPIKAKMFQTDKTLNIQTEWGEMTAVPGDWIAVKDDGTFGPPRKPDVIETDYELVNE